MLSVANLSALRKPPFKLSKCLQTALLACILSYPILAQTALTKDLTGLVPPKAPGPVLINFWATWCGPCKYEFPFLVKIDEDFRSKGLTFNVVSVDNPTFVEDQVPEFLRQYEARMPSYLIDAWKRPEKAKIIRKIAPRFPDGYPFTVLLDKKGKIAYQKSGVVNEAVLRKQIKKLLKDVR